MNTFLTDVDPLLIVALSIAGKASALVAVAAIAQVLLRRRASAAMRHFIWTLVIGGMLLLPLLSPALPEWTVVVRTAPPADPAAPVVSSVGAEDVPLPNTPPSSPLDVGRTPYTPAAQPRTDVAWPAVIGILYATGAGILLLHLAWQHRGVRRLARQASEVHDVEWIRLLSDCARRLGVDRPVRLLRSREQSMPMAFGARRPAILIPAVADTWPADRRRAVLLHELAHVARYDCLTQMFAFAACAMYWFHPAAWWIARRLRVERELACDDRVIAAGTQARDYAGHLLEIAYAFGSHRAPALAVSMARPRQLEGRMLAVLDAARNRRVPSRRARLTALAITTALLLPLAAATATSAPAVPVAPAVAEAGDTAPRVDRSTAAAVDLGQDTYSGTWEIRPSKAPDTVHLQLMERDSQSGTLVPIRQLEGLPVAHLTGPGGQVQFRIRRDGGH